MDIIKDLDINSLIKLYLSNKKLNKVLNTEYVLMNLSDLYKIDYRATFTDFIKEYDDVYLKKGCSLTKNVGECARIAAARGSWHLLLQAQKTGKIGKTSYDRVMASAAKGGHIDIVLWAQSQGADEYDWVMEYAAEGGHMDIVLWAQSQGANDYDWTMVLAAFSGHMDIVLWTQS